MSNSEEKTEENTVATAEMFILQSSYNDMFEAYMCFKQCRTAHEDTSRRTGDPPLTLSQRSAYNLAVDAFDEMRLELVYEVCKFFDVMEDE
jgi:hypothetical protein